MVYSECKLSVQGWLKAFWILFHKKESEVPLMSFLRVLPHTMIEQLPPQGFKGSEDELYLFLQEKDLSPWCSPCSQFHP